jgi:hypothetical protein
LNEKKQLIKSYTRSKTLLENDNKQYFYHGDVRNYQENCIRLAELTKKINIMKKEVGIIESSYFEEGI